MSANALAPALPDLALYCAASNNALFDIIADARSLYGPENTPEDRDAAVCRAVCAADVLDWRGVDVPDLHPLEMQSILSRGSSTPAPFGSPVLAEV